MPLVRTRGLFIVALVIVRILLSCEIAVCEQNFTSSGVVQMFGVHEVVLSGDGSAANPLDTIATVTFTPPSGAKNSKTADAFYDGEDTWRARVYVNEVGGWKWNSESSTDTGLNGKSGEFTAVASKLPGRLLPHPKNSRHWIKEKGEWFLNLNDTAYFLLCARDGNGDVVSDDEAVQYVRDDVDRGITSVRCFLTSSGSGFAESKDLWLGWFFQDGNLAKFRLDNFQCTDRRLQMLLNMYPDVAVQLILFPLEAYNRDDRFWASMTIAQRERLLRYLIARFAAYPQLFWLITNDAHYGPKFPNNNAMVREIGTYLREHDRWQHPLSTGHARMVPYFFGNEDWSTYVHVELLHDLGAKQYDQYHKLKKPVFLGEDRYEQDHGPSRDPIHMRYWQRRLYWSWLLSGGSANYGGRWWTVQPVSETGVRTATFHQRKQTTFSKPLTGLDSVIHIREYFKNRNIELCDFEPDPSLVKDPTVQDAMRAPKAMRRDKSEFLIYHPSAAEDGANAHGDDSNRPKIVVDLNSAIGEYEVEWYRVIDGVSKQADSITGGTAIQLTSPWIGHDVVLRMVKK